MKSSKYTQATTPNDNEYIEYQNIVTVIPQNESHLHQPSIVRAEFPASCAHVNDSEEHLLGDGYDHDKNVCGTQKCGSERNANKYVQAQEFELTCNYDVHPNKQRLKQHYTSEQNIASANRNFCSMSKLDNPTNSSQYSLDRKSVQGKQPSKQKHIHSCEQNPKVLQRIERGASLKRMQSPEIINIHRGPNNVLYDSYGPENCAIKTYGFDRDFKCDDYGFRRGPSIKRTSERSNGSQSRSKRRAAGDGMDAEMDEPELIFELTEQMRDCQCACDHVIYTPGYTTCLPLINVFTKIIGIKDCPGYENGTVETHLTIRPYNETSQKIFGKVSITSTIDDEIKMQIRGMKLVQDEWEPDKIYLHDRSFCKIVDNYLWQASNTSDPYLKSLCPIRHGLYQFYEFSPDFKEIQFPPEMLGYMKFQIELKRQNEVLACKVVELVNTPRNLEHI